MATFELFGSEEAGSGTEITLSAEQPVREPEADAAVELDAQLTKDWMNTITTSLVSLQTSFAQLTKQKKSKKSKRQPDIAISSAEER